MNGIGKTGMNDNRDPISIWRVYLPLGVDRGVYIQDCFLTGMITLTNENGEIISGVKVGKLAIQQIDFPESSELQGSEVACVKSPYSGKIYVVEVFNTNQQYSAQEESQYRFYKTNGIGSSGILIDGRGNIILTVDGEDGQGNVILNVTNQARTGKLTIVVNGDVLVDNDGTTTIKSTKGVVIESNGSTISIDDAGVNIDSGENNTFLNGGNQILYSKVPGATEIIDISEIGVSQKVMVG